jgi:preprotein translocase subunit SecG
MNFQKMTKQQLKDYGESIGIKLNLKHKKDDLIDQLNNASQTNVDNTIKADVKVEVTNATTEKAFKAVGDTISSGKQAVTTGAKATTSFAKKIMIPVIILAIIGGIIGYANYINEQKKSQEYWDRVTQENENLAQYRKARQLHCKAQREEILPTMTENQSCVYYEFKSYSQKDWEDDPWGSVKIMCRLSYSKLTHYKDWYYDKFESCH